MSSNGRGSFMVANTERELGQLPSTIYCMIVPCKVKEAPNKGKIRCVVHEGGEDEFLTEWIPWFAPSAGNTREWSPPDVGEKGVLFSPSGRLQNAYFMPGVFSEDALLPSDQQDEHKIIYLKEEIGLYTYDRRTGRRRWRIHGGGEYRHEIGIFEDTGDENTSDIIQRKDMIQMRVGNTRFTIIDGMIRAYVVGPDGQNTDLKIDGAGLDAIANNRGLLKLRKGEATIGVSSIDVAATSAPELATLSGMIATDEAAQLAYRDRTVMMLSEEASIENQVGKSRFVLNEVGTRIMADGSAFTLTGQVIDVRVPGSSVTLTPVAIIQQSTSFPIIPGAAQGATFQQGQMFKFNTPNKLPAFATPPPAKISKQFKPYMPEE